jgi:histidyl-tRNA synthetase
MTDKEKKAIEFMKFYKETCLNREKNNVLNYETISDEDFVYKNIDTILNLIQKQEKEIELSNKVIDKRNQEKLKLVEILLKKNEIINNAINEIENIRQYFSEDLQPDFIKILEILKDKKVIDW